jgi:hypothetical protein
MDCGFEFAKPNLKSPFKKPVGEATGSIMLGKRFDGRKVTPGSAIASHGDRDRGGAYRAVCDRVVRAGLEGGRGVK